MRFCLAALAFLLCSSCAAIPNQLRPPSEYANVVYNSTQAAIVTEQEALDFLERDKTDRNVWIADKYMCQEFATDLWWNAYMEGIEGCLVAVFRGSQGHWLVKFHTTEGWLWIEPHTDFTGDECWNTVYFILCGQEAFDACIFDWDLYYLCYGEEEDTML